MQMIYAEGLYSVLLHDAAEFTINVGLLYLRKFSEANPSTMSVLKLLPSSKAVHPAAKTTCSTAGAYGGNSTVAPLEGCS
jgi:hypothetical protein